MKFLALIQARCGSTRFPDKVLKDLEGKPLLLRVIERVQKSKNVDEVIVVTSINKENIPLIKLCAVNNVRVVCGSENDVLDRFYQTVKLIKPDYIIRVTADCPFYDYTILDKAIESLKSNTDYLADLDETLADGLDIEIIKYSALELSWQNARLQSEREHVTLYIKNNKDKFVIQNFKSPIKDISNKRWTIDETEDYEFAKIIYKHFIDNSNEFFTADDILTYTNENKELEQMNSKFHRNEGLVKSLKEDKII